MNRYIFPTWTNKVIPIAVASLAIGGVYAVADTAVRLRLGVAWLDGLGPTVVGLREGLPAAGGLAMPSHASAHVPLGVLDVLVLIGVCGLFAAAINRGVGRHPLVPARDPRLHESLAFQNV